MSDQTKKPIAAFSPRTQLVHGATTRSQHQELSEAIFLTQGFAYPDAETAEARFTGEQPGYVYARYNNPTIAMFEERMAMIEGAEAGFATASGMAAVNAVLTADVKAGDHIVAGKALFGSSLYILTELLPRFGVEVSFVDAGNLEEWAAAMRPQTKLAFFETPSNPTLEICDIRAIANIVSKTDAKLAIDNVFGTPLFQKPLELGADIVIYSTTKHIDGQGRCLGGIVLGKQDYIKNTIETYMKHTGGAMSPFNGWVMLKGLETLNVRVCAQAASAYKICDALQGHEKLKSCLYPTHPAHPQQALALTQMSDGGTVLAIDLKGGKEAAFRFMNALSIPKISNNLGDSRSIVTHPATTTHQRLDQETRDALGIGDGLLRFSVGLEAADDLIEDIKNALSMA